MTDTQHQIDLTSLERIVPDDIHADEATGCGTLRLHLDRYQFAKQHLVQGSVLDIACGAGYGTALLSESPLITSALGVDICDEAIAYAAKRYASRRASYERKNALEFSPIQPFDNVVSLETIEHVGDPAALFALLVSWTAPGGRLIASVPITPSVDVNPHHKTNFSANSFRRMADRHPLRYVNSFIQVQPFNPSSIALRRETRAVNMRRNLALFYLRNPSQLFSRLWSLWADGFVNKYVTVVYERTR
jgi:2-polyprenyl-3-methyl-5-hydroxy-6-metoxy-1,4-benzoquinol methylase